MLKKPNWLWTVFFFLYVLTVFSGLGVFFQKDSVVQGYYQILMSFETLFLIHYLLNVLALAFDILAIIPFYVFIQPNEAPAILRHFSTGIWKWFFAIRIALLVVGHSFVYKQIQALFHNDLWVTLAVINLTLLFYAPSYLANFIIAYRQEKKASH